MPRRHSLKSFDQEKLITKRLLFTIRIAHSKAETQQHATFGQYVLNNTKALTKVTKDHQKKPKSLLATIIFNRLTVTINDGSPFQKSLSVLIRAPHVTISFNDTGFCSMLATILPRCKTNPKFTNDKSIRGILTQSTVYHDKNEKQQ